MRSRIRCVPGISKFEIPGICFVAGHEGLLVHLDYRKSSGIGAGGFYGEGLPVGIQIVGRDKQDFSVLQMAYAFEQATGFGKRRPGIV